VVGENLDALVKVQRSTLVLIRSLKVLFDPRVPARMVFARELAISPTSQKRAECACHLQVAGYQLCAGTRAILTKKAYEFDMRECSVEIFIVELEKIQKLILGGASSLEEHKRAHVCVKAQIGRVFAELVKSPVIWDRVVAR